MNPKSPEPAGIPPQFGPDSWRREEAKPPRTARPACTLPQLVSAASFRDFCGPRRMEEWGKACEDFVLNFESFIRIAGSLVNPIKHLTPRERHLDARGHVRNQISDGIRAARNSDNPPNIPRPPLY